MRDQKSSAGPKGTRQNCNDIPRLNIKRGSRATSFLDKNNDVFAWRTSDLMGVSRDIIEHKLQVNPLARSRKQRLHKMSDEKVAIAKAEVQRLLDA
jgi:hypothetical protein